MVTRPYSKLIPDISIIATTAKSNQLARLQIAWLNGATAAYSDRGIISVPSSAEIPFFSKVKFFSLDEMAGFPALPSD
jgi:hypothetical protein